MNSITKDQMITAFLSRDSSYDGKFYVGVTTTRIYCIPSCKARKPRVENMVFFQNRGSAIAAGFRGCLRCKSDLYPDIHPPWFDKILLFMEEEDSRKITEQGLVDIAQVNISTIRRYFKEKMRTTPMVYHRRIRLEKARKLIEKGVDSSTVASRTGFKSLSGFREAFMREFGVPPGKNNI